MLIFYVLPYLAALVLANVALEARRDPGIRPRNVLAMSQTASYVALATAIAAAISVLVWGPMTSPALGIGYFKLALRVDALSTILFSLVSFVGVICIRFSKTYMDGDDRQGRFMGWLCVTLACVGMLVMSGTLFQFALAWVGTSLALHKLLLFYPNRRPAQIAAAKKWVSARISDVCILFAFTLMAIAFGTGEIALIAERAKEMAAAGTLPWEVAAATFLIAIAALLKSAQFPAHGWLIEVMETPTPVSALLHAGIVNAGGFLVIRFADVMLMSTTAMIILAVVGGFTALFASAVMLTQSSVKVSLAWSTVAQMGFMLMQCGFGAFSAAVLHIVAHSLYKAHAFLSSGSIIDMARAAGPKPKRAPASLAVLIFSASFAVGIYGAIGFALGYDLGSSPAVVGLGAILIMGMTHLMLLSVDDRPEPAVFGRIVVAAGAMSAAYFALQIGTAAWLGSAVPETVAPAGVLSAIIALAVLSFAALLFAQHIPQAIAGTSSGRGIYIHLLNGFYANAYFNRLVGALDRRAAAKS